MWMIVLLLFFGLMTYQISDRVVMFWNNPLVVNIHEKKLESIEFPDVVVCNAMQANGVHLVGGSLIPDREHTMNPSPAMPQRAFMGRQISMKQPFIGRMSSLGLGEENGIPHDLLAVLSRIRDRVGDINSQTLTILKDLPSQAARLRELATVNTNSTRYHEELLQLKKELIDFPEISSLLEPLESLCGKGWYLDRKTGNCYHSDGAKRTWMLSRDYCRSLGGDLASLHSDRETNSLKEISRKLFKKDWAVMGSAFSAESGFQQRPPQDFPEMVWIGLNDFHSEGYFKWSDGSPTDYYRWLKEGGSNFGDGVIFNDGLWQDMNHEFLGYSICQKSLNVSSLCPLNWVFSHQGQRCYMAVRKKKNWTDAENHCMSHGGGHIASIHRIEDREEILELYAEARKTSTFDIWTGLNDRESEGSFVWSDGSEGDFQPWDSGQFLKEGLFVLQPNDFWHREDCVVVTSGGSFEDKTCSKHMGFVCSRPSYRQKGSDSFPLYMPKRLGTAEENAECALMKAAELLENISRVDLRELSATSAPKAEDMIIHCNIGEQSCNVSMEVMEEGICVKFSPNDQRNVSSSGSDTGFTALIDLMPFEAIPGFPTGSAKIFLSPPDLTGPIDSGAFQGYPGQAVRVEIDKAYKMVKDQRNCGRKNLKHYDTYTEAACLWEEEVQQQIEVCQCLPIITPAITDNIKAKATEVKEIVPEPQACIAQIDGVQCAHYRKDICRGPDSYTGSQSVTVNGARCKDWSGQSYHNVSGHNFCRNPDRSESPWCYAYNTEIDSKKPVPASKQYRYWEFCFPDCAKVKEEPKTCLETHGNETCAYFKYYRCRADQRDVSRSVTQFNMTCARWSMYLPPENWTITERLATNCRNPNADLAPWCYVSKSAPVDYSEDYCFEDCSHYQPQNLQTSRPNCRIADSSIMNTTCSIFEQLDCVQKLDFLNTTDLIDTDCPADCSQMYYTADVSGGHLVEDDLLSYLHRGWEQALKVKLQKFEDISVHLPEGTRALSAQVAEFHADFRTFYEIIFKPVFLEASRPLPCTEKEKYENIDLIRILELRSAEYLMSDRFASMSSIMDRFSAVPTPTLSNITDGYFEMVFETPLANLDGRQRLKIATGRDFSDLNGFYKNVRLSYASPPHFACEPLNNTESEVNGTVMLIERGRCTFIQKTLMAMETGAIAAIITNSLKNDTKFQNLGGSREQNATNRIRMPTFYLPGDRGRIITDYMKENPEKKIFVDHPIDFKSHDSPAQKELLALKTMIEDMRSVRLDQISLSVLDEAEEQLAVLRACLERRGLGKLIRDADLRIAECNRAVSFFNHGSKLYKKTVVKWETARSQLIELQRWWEQSWELVWKFMKDHSGAFASPQRPTEVQIARDYAPGSANEAEIKRIWEHFRMAGNAFGSVTDKFNEQRHLLGSPEGLYEKTGSVLRDLIKGVDELSLKLFFPQLLQKLEKLTMLKLNETDNSTIELDTMEKAKRLSSNVSKCFRQNQHKFNKFSKELHFLSPRWMERFCLMFDSLLSYTPGFHYARKNFMLLQVYFREMEIIFSEQAEAYNVWQFLSDAGGTGGLYLGATLVTIFELVSLLIGACGYQMSHDEIDTFRPPTAAVHDQKFRRMKQHLAIQDERIAKVKQSQGKIIQLLEKMAQGDGRMQETSEISYPGHIEEKK